ncbi:MAG: branched-chain-amino-acid transaminase [Raineya sp.]
MSSGLVFFNGDFLSQFALSNRAFEYGDGIFESLIAHKQTIQFWQSHYQRLWEGCKALRLDLPPDFSASFLENTILTLAQKNNLNDFYRIKINVWRRAGGLYSPTERQVEYLLRVYPYQPHQEKVKHRAIFFGEIPLVYSAISPFKTLNSLPYVLAGIATQEQDAQEAVLLSREGYVAEAIASNVFWIKENQVFTPSLFCGGKRGVMQEKIFEKIKNLGISLKIGEFSPEDLLQAQVVFTSNVAGIVAIRSIEDKVFQTEHEFLDIFRELQIKQAK